MISYQHSTGKLILALILQCTQKKIICGAHHRRSLGLTSPVVGEGVLTYSATMLRERPALYTWAALQFSHFMHRIAFRWQSIKNIFLKSSAWFLCCRFCNLNLIPHPFQVIFCSLNGFTKLISSWISHGWGSLGFLSRKHLIDYFRQMDKAFVFYGCLVNRRKTILW